MLHHHRHPGPYDIVLIPHSHLDVEWYWTYDKTRAWSRKIFRDMLSLLEQNPEETFVQDQVPLTDLIAGELDADRLEWLQKLHAEGRFEIAGGYIQPELLEPHGECLIRQLVFGRRRTEDTFGIAPDVGWFVDSFGQIPQVAQILRGCGMRGYVFMRGVPAALGEPPAVFRYRSPDGTEILTLWLSSEYTTWSENLEKSVLTEVAHASSDQVAVMWGTDVSNPDHMPASEARKAVQEIARKHDIPVRSVKISTPGRLFDTLSESTSDLPVLDCDFSPAHDRFADLRGTYSNRVGLKVANRRCEQALLSSEMWDAVSIPVTGRSVDSGQELLDLAWQKLLYNQFHDIIGGSCSDQVYDKAMMRYGTVADLADDVADTAVDRIASCIDTSGLHNPLVVMNSLSWNRTDIAEFEFVSRDEPADIRVVNQLGNAVPYHIPPETVRRTVRGGITSCHILWRADDVPGCGYSMYSINEIHVDDMPQTSTKAGDRIENEWFQVSVNSPTGDVEQIVEIESGRDILSGCGNEILARYEDNPDLEGTVRVNGKTDSTSDCDTATVRVERNGLYERVISEIGMPFCRKLIRTVTLYQGIRRIDFETRLIGFTGNDLLLTTRFPVAVSDDAECWYETPYAMTRRESEYHCAQTLALITDQNTGAALVNTGSAGYWPFDGGLELVLLRSISDYRGYYAPGAAEHGDHVLRYSLVPFAGDWRDSDVIRHAHGVNRPLTSHLTDSHTGDLPRHAAFFETTPENVAVTAVKSADEGGALVLRVTELAGRACTAEIRPAFPFQNVDNVTMEERDPESADVPDGLIRVPLRGFEIATVRVEYVDSIR